MPGSKLLLPGESLAGKMRYDKMVAQLASRYAATTGIVLQKTIANLHPVVQERIKQTASRKRSQMGQDTTVELIDQGPSPDLLFQQQQARENFLIERGINPATSNTDILAGQGRSVKLTRDKNGNIVSREIAPSNSALLSPQEREAMSAVRRYNAKLEALHKRIVGNSVQTEAARKTSLKAMRDYVYQVSKSFMIHGNIATSNELLKILAGSKAYTDAAVLAAFEKGLMEQLREVSKLELYINALQHIQSKKVALFINDGRLLEASNNMAQILQAVSFEVGSQITKLIYITLQEAFEEAWSGINTDAFPLLYRNLIRRQIKYAQKRNLIKLIGNKVTSWQILADFDEIFGDKGDLQRGYHYGAFLGGEGADAVEYKPQVRLPFTNQLLRNPVSIRYAYWLAMWTDQKFFSPTFNKWSVDERFRMGSRKEHAFSTQQRLDRLNKRKQSLEDRLEGERNSQVRTMMYSSRSSPKDRWERRQYRVVLDDILAEMNDINEKIGHIERGVAYSTKYKKTQPRKIKNAKEQKQRTIQARTAYWAQINKAPIWILLEFGQLRYAPRIPPRGVYYRFVAKMQKKIRELVRQAQNKTSSKTYGYTVEPNGRRRVATAQSGEEVIQFWLNPDVIGRPFKPGELLPADKGLYRKITIARNTVKRTIAEASKIGANTAASKALVTSTEAATRGAITALSKSTGSTMKGYTPYVETKKIHPRMAGSAMFYGAPRPPTPLRLTSAQLFESPYLGSSNLVRGSGSSGSTVVPTYQPAPLSAYMTRDEYGTYSNLPNKGLRMAYLKKKMAKRRGA